MFRGVVFVCSEMILNTHIHCEQNATFCNVTTVMHVVTTVLWKVTCFHYFKV